MNDAGSQIRTSRSLESFRFEALVKNAVAPGSLPKLIDIDFRSLGDIGTWTAVVHPCAVTRRLTITHVGLGLTTKQEHDWVGRDYLDFVDPAYKGEAFDSAFLMLARPCGLWQITPVHFDDGTDVKCEYTGLPIFDELNGRGVILFMIKHDLKQLPDIKFVGHASEWEWLDLRAR